MLADRVEHFVARQSGVRHQRFDLIGIEHLCEIVGRNGFVWSAADPGIHRVALTRLLELLEQIVEAAAQDRSRSTGAEQAAQAVLENVADVAASIRGLSGRRRAGARRSWARAWRGRKALDGLVGKQAEHRHGDRRHTFATWAAARIGRAARAILHSVENIYQTHGRLLRSDVADFSDTVTTTKHVATWPKCVKSFKNLCAQSRR